MRRGLNYGWEGLALGVLGTLIMGGALINEAALNDGGDPSLRGGFS